MLCCAVLCETGSFGLAMTAKSSQDRMNDRSIGFSEYLAKWHPSTLMVAVPPTSARERQREEKNLRGRLRSGEVRMEGGKEGRKEGRTPPTPSRGMNPQARHRVRPRRDEMCAR